MKLLANTLICSVIAFTATTSFAQEDSKKSETMPKEEMMKKRMATEDCKAHMTSMKRDGVMKDASGNVMNKDGTKRDEAMMKHDTMCVDMMKKDSMPAEPMKK